MHQLYALLVDHPEVRLPSLQSVRNAAARLISYLTLLFHISVQPYMAEQLRWLPPSAHIQILC